VNSDLADIEASISVGRETRDRVGRNRSRLALAVSVGVLVIWLGFVTLAGHWGRVSDQWASALTMVFGSFVAGSTPQGGGAVAFPVFTKVLDIDASVARTFSLCIQSIGMTAASASIIINRRVVAWRAVAISAPVAVSAFVISAIVLGDPDTPFWPSRLPGAYVKVSFTLLVAAMALVVWSGYRVQILERVQALDLSGPRVVAALVLAAIAGGMASALTGSGADVISYLAVVVVIGLSPRVGVPTTVIVMTTVSLAGLVLYGVVDGQLNVSVVDDAVVAIGGRPVEMVDGAAQFVSVSSIAGGGAAAVGLDALRFDLFGLWLAAVPVVAFGAPLGAWATSRVTDRQLVRFVVVLAVVETVSTVIFLDGLISEPDPALISFALIGGASTVTILWLIRKYRRQILGLAESDFDASFTRSRLDVGPQFQTQLDEETST